MTSILALSLSWLQIESRTYWSVFAAGFVLVAIWETIRPKRALSLPAERRWARHGLLLIVCAVVSAAVLRLTPVATAAALAGTRIGLFNRISVPFALRFVIAVVALDFTRYAVHWSLHATRLWHVHQVHHSDPDFDVSTGARVHPIEVIYGQAANLAVITALAAPVTAVFAVELASLAQSFFSHANVSLPGWLERPLRRVWVTPDMHRIHHSTEIAEQSRNLSELFSFWDRLFGTYLADPAAGQDGMRIGLDEFQGERGLDLKAMLLRPLRFGK